MTITAAILADSISTAGVRLTTMQLRYPRFVHAEFMTHRAFSRNASSSRAIPVERMIQDVLRDPAMPSYWGKNQPGMQAGEELSDADKRRAVNVWNTARYYAIQGAERLHAQGVHKQIVNRVLESFSHINVVVTATDYDNFFSLRRHADAQPEIRILADAMFDAMASSAPRTMLPGQWHLPYVADDSTSQDDAAHPAKLSTARCARVSYLTHEGKRPNTADDLRLYGRLVGSMPLHASPAEHPATPDPFNQFPGQHGNFTGWRQFRRMLPGGWRENTRTQNTPRREN